MNDTILIELRSEELPPKTLKSLSEAFAEAVFSALRAQEFTTPDSRCTAYTTPRRLALAITGIAARQPDRVLEKKGPGVAGGLDADGKPTRACDEVSPKKEQSALVNINTDKTPRTKLFETRMISPSIDQPAQLNHDWRSNSRNKIIRLS